MPDAPKQVETDTQAIIDGWTELASTATFAGMTLAEYTAAVQPSFDARKKVAQLEIDLKAAQDARDQADVTTTKTNAAGSKRWSPTRTTATTARCMKKWVMCAKAPAGAD